MRHCRDVECLESAFKCGDCGIRLDAEESLELSVSKHRLSLMVDGVYTSTLQLE